MRSSRSGISALPSKIQQAAAQQLVAQWSADLGTPPTASEVAEVMGLLLAAVLEAQVTDSVVIDSRAHSLLGRRLLTDLRGELLRNWKAAGVPETDLVPLLAAFEQVRDTISPDAPQSFSAQLAGTDGLRLLIDVVHDLRSPLTSILFLAETIQRGQSGPVTDVQRRQLGIIYTAALGLSSVASDIIDLTRSQMLVELKPVPFSIGGVLESVHEIVRPIAEEKQLSVRFIPPGVDERLGHPVALSRVLLNLTSNALKFTNQGYVEISARDVAPGRVDFAVADSGRGIDAARMPTLFDPVRRGRPSGQRDEHISRLFSQTGLGLSICRKLVATMGSELQVESRVGWGTRFHFTLELPPCASRRPPSRVSGPGKRTAERRRVTPDPRVD
ncbi:MAG TPA: HAMP domain-containing sensor histidine kinase [Gemmatimonadales bacterium]